MTEIEVRPFDKEKLRDILTDELDKKMNEIADFIFSESQMNLVQNQSFGVTGNLYRKVTLKKYEPLHKEIIYEVPYADFIEFGTLPHKMNPEVLVEWCMKKLGLGPQEARQAAYAIANKIRSEGMEPKPFLRPAIAKAIERYGGL